VTAFIGTTKYKQRKETRFRKGDNLNIAENEAFLIRDPETRQQYTAAYQNTAGLYFETQIPFEAILQKIQNHIDQL